MVKNLQYKMVTNLQYQENHYNREPWEISNKKI